MNPFHAHKIQQSFLEFARIDNWQSLHAVTLTMRQGIRTDPSGPVEYLDRDKAVQNFRHFANLLNRRVLGKRFERFGEQLPVIPVLEGGGRYKRLHYHAAIDCPRTDLEPIFPAIIQSAWAQTRWAYNETDIQAGADQGWINYISKPYDKPDYADAIDWENYNNLD